MTQEKSTPIFAPGRAYEARGAGAHRIIRSRDHITRLFVSGASEPFVSRLACTTRGARLAQPLS
eukprot:4496816-Prymnesium_polylepis.1